MDHSSRYLTTYISDYLDLLVLHLIEDICIAEDVQDRSSYFVLFVKKPDKLLQLCTSFFKVFGEFLSSGFICRNRSMQV